MLGWIWRFYQGATSTRHIVDNMKHTTPQRKLRLHTRYLEIPWLSELCLSQVSAVSWCQGWLLVLRLSSWYFWYDPEPLAKLQATIENTCLESTRNQKNVLDSGLGLAIFPPFFVVAVRGSLFDTKSQQIQDPQRLSPSISPKTAQRQGNLQRIPVLRLSSTKLATSPHCSPICATPGNVFA